MQNKAYPYYDILIAGAGFAGSLTALILHNLGFKVCLLERGKHPRFIIGESSTPIADMILRDLSRKYNLTWLSDFSRYGSWQRAHPEIVCGIKRGFSFFKHYPGRKFSTNREHCNELLVAASNEDALSDTNWLREDFDAFLVNKVKEAGIDYYDLAEIASATKEKLWKFHVSRMQMDLDIETSFFIDATGSGGLLYRLLGMVSSSQGMLTDSFAMYSHFRQVLPWKDKLQLDGISTEDFPYNPDNSALHHILDEGWLWMLRFNDLRTSLGFVIDGSNPLHKGFTAERAWEELVRKYPSIEDVLKDTKMVSPPGQIIMTGRLQRKITCCFGSGWVALPNTAGFIDPLFSSGIAHTLSGVERVIAMVNQHWANESLLLPHLKEYDQAVLEELKFLDYLVAGCYKTMAYFELFSTWSMFYFATAIAHERRRTSQSSTGYFLNADDMDFREAVQVSFRDLLKITHQKRPTRKDIRWFTSLVKERIEPFNTAGLMEPDARNMYRHTVTTE